jgi:hypothetical protein
MILAAILLFTVGLPVLAGMAVAIMGPAAGVLFGLEFLALVPLAAFAGFIL